MAEKILKRMRFDNSTVAAVSTLILYHDFYVTPSETKIKKLLSKLGCNLFEKLLKVQRADAMAKNPEYGEKSVEYIAEAEQIYCRIIKNRECYNLKMLGINGDDVLKLGFDGKAVGEVLAFALDAVIENKTGNTKDSLINFIKKNYK